jgi:hypothetical protein
MVIRRALLLFLAFVMITSCMVPIKPHMKDTARLDSGKGVMVVHLAVPYLQREGHQAICLSVVNVDNGSAVSFPITSAEDYIVIPLPTGRYRWRGITIGYYYAALSPMMFDIDEGKINYIGDIGLIMDDNRIGATGHPKVHYYLRVYDYHRDVMNALAPAYPALLENYPSVVNLTHSTPLQKNS